MASPTTVAGPAIAPPVADVAGTVLRLCSVFEPSAAALARPDAAAYDVIGGMQNHTATLTAHLDAGGVRQHVITSRLGGPRSRVIQGIGTTVVRTGAPVRAARQLWIPGALREATRRTDWGVVHAHQGEDLAVLPLAELAARRAGCPLVVTLHCSLRRTVRLDRHRPLSVFGPAVERRALLQADAVIVLTTRAAEAAVDDGVKPDRVHVLPSGYDPALFGMGTAEAAYDDPLPLIPRPRVLFAGRLAPQKRPLDAVLAHARMPPDVHLVMVGDGPLRSAVQAAVAASPARDRVHLVGLVPHERIPAFLAHADAFVLPSHYEELGSVLVEAMASGLPVVANDVGGIPSLVEDGVTGRLVRHGDVAGLGDTVTGVLADRPGAQAMALAGAGLVARRYAWPSLAAATASVYAELQAR